eukprot:3330128-Prymnesium_polylepis.1
MIEAEPRALQTTQVALISSELVRPQSALTRSSDHLVRATVRPRSQSVCGPRVGRRPGRQRHQSRSCLLYTSPSPRDAHES